MKKIFFIAVLILLACPTFAQKVKRMGADANVELDGYWSDTDVKLVCADIVEQIIASPRIARFYERNKRDPIVTIGKVRNESDEFIDTKIVSNNLRNAIIKSGVLEFMADSSVRDALRDEAIAQADHANEEQAKAIDNEDAADFMLTGSIKTIVQQNGKQSYRVYYVTVELNDLETHRIVDSFEPNPENQPRKLFKKKR